MCSDDAEGVRVQFAEGDAVLQCDHTVLHLLNGSVARPRRELLALGASVLMPSLSMRLHATTAHYTRSVLLGHFTLGRSGSNGMTIQYRSEQQWIFTIAIGSDSSLDCSLINVDLHVPRDPVKTMKIDAPRTRGAGHPDQHYPCQRIYSNGPSRGCLLEPRPHTGAPRNGRLVCVVERRQLSWRFGKHTSGQAVTLSGASDSSELRSARLDQTDLRLWVATSNSGTVCARNGSMMALACANALFSPSTYWFASRSCRARCGQRAVALLAPRSPTMERNSRSSGLGALRTVNGV